jgi:diguanylate cyclase (GGDEF)-like protein
MDTSDGLIAVTMSIGVSAWAPGGAAAEPEALVRAADEALYRAKNGGRNRVAAAAESGLGAPAASR